MTVRDFVIHQSEFAAVKCRFIVDPSTQEYLTADNLEKYWSKNIISWELSDNLFKPAITLILED